MEDYEAQEQEFWRKLEEGEMSRSQQIRRRRFVRRTVRCIEPAFVHVVTVMHGVPRPIPATEFDGWRDVVMMQRGLGLSDSTAPVDPA